MAGAAAPADTLQHVWRPYTAQLGRQCPAKHLELLSPADLRDALDSYTRHVPASVRRAMASADRRSCRNVIAGASCSNAASLSVAEDTRTLPTLAASVCGQFETCREQSDCDPASAHAVEQAIHRNGAAAAAASLSNAEWDIALDEAADGRADWIDAIAALRTATDGARSEAIDGALSDALLSNPVEVLKLLATRTDLPGVPALCEDRTIEPTKAESRQHIAAALAAVGQVSDLRLQRVRVQCLASLRNAAA
ncbi:hypothetical protein [Sphingomonas sp. R86521]|uniref:hypothetical protein n=1 Tax=Sphingomonas sp. R86521 TaxID=3093860 RepID=UPI0036D429A5